MMAIQIIASLTLLELWRMSGYRCRMTFKICVRNVAQMKKAEKKRVQEERTRDDLMSLISNCNLDEGSGMTRGLSSPVLDVLEVQFHGELGPVQFLSQIGGV
jgi:hypothetical protein